MKYSFLFIIASAFFFFVGCEGAWIEKEYKGYDSYDVGAFINGVEYHESSSSSFDQKLCDFGIVAQVFRDTIVVFRTPTNCLLMAKNHPGYELRLVFVTDSLFFAANNKEISFNTYIDECNLWLNKADNPQRYGEFEQLPLVYGAIEKRINVYHKELGYYQTHYIPYVIQEGWVKMNRFVPVYGDLLYVYDNLYNFYVNADKITFECTAKSEGGDILEVKQGYFSRYTHY
jgi:hypothetical protein